MPIFTASSRWNGVDLDLISVDTPVWRRRKKKEMMIISVIDLVVGHCEYLAMTAT